MKITKTYNWNRRDFQYDAKCEHCGHETKDNSGYDDSNYYNNVVPDAKCPNCGESTNSKATDTGEPKTVIVPRHDPNAVI
jgi:hypothetical protein